MYSLYTFGILLSWPRDQDAFERNKGRMLTTLLFPRQNILNGASGNFWIAHFYAREKKIRGEDGQEGQRSLGIEPRVKSLRSSYTRLYSQRFSGDGRYRSLAIVRGNQLVPPPLLMSPPPVRFSGFRVSGVGFQVSGVEFQVSSFYFRVSGAGF